MCWRPPDWVWIKEIGLGKVTPPTIEHLAGRDTTEDQNLGINNMREKDQEIDIEDLIVKIIKEVPTDIGPTAGIKDRVTEMIDLTAEKATNIAETTAIIERDKAEETRDHMIEIDNEVPLEKKMRAKGIQEVLVKTEIIIQAMCTVSDVGVTTSRSSAQNTHFIKGILARSASSNMRQDSTNKDHKVGKNMEGPQVVQSLRDQKTGTIKNQRMQNLDTYRISNTEKEVTASSLLKCTLWDIILQKITYLGEQKIR